MRGNKLEGSCWATMRTSREKTQRLRSRSHGGAPLWRSRRRTRDTASPDIAASRGSHDGTLSQPSESCPSSSITPTMPWCSWLCPCTSAPVLSVSAEARWVLHACKCLDRDRPHCRDRDSIITIIATTTHSVLLFKLAVDESLRSSRPLSTLQPARVATGVMWWGLMMRRPPAVPLSWPNQIRAGTNTEGLGCMCDTGQDATGRPL